MHSEGLDASPLLLYCSGMSGLGKFSLLGLAIFSSSCSISAGDFQKQCAEVEKKAIDFLATNQSAAGGFTTYEWRTLTPDKKRPIDTPFTVSQVLYSLSFCPDDTRVRSVREKAVAYLVSQRESPGVWRYQGAKDFVPPDVDDTSLAWAALKRANNSIPSEALAALRASRNEAGLFNTWIGDPSTWAHIDSREIDPVVNLNALLLFGMAGEKIDRVCEYGVEQLESEQYRRGSVYYPSPLAFLFAVSRAYSEGKVNCFSPNVPEILNATRALQEKDGGWGTDYETALGLVSLLNLGEKGEAVEKGVNLLVSRQMADGGWALSTTYSGANTWLGGGRFFYGSRIVTTALCVEALAKYLAR